MELSTYEGTEIGGVAVGVWGLRQRSGLWFSTLNTAPDAKYRVKEFR